MRYEFGTRSLLIIADEERDGQLLAALHSFLGSSQSVNVDLSSDANPIGNPDNKKAVVRVHMLDNQIEEVTGGTIAVKHPLGKKNSPRSHLAQRGQ